MKQFTKNLRWLLASLMLVVGVGSAWADSDPYYTLVTTTDAAKTTNNSYAGTGTVTMDGIEWAVNGNGQIYPWRLGGKSISNTNRTVNTNTAMGSAINKVVLTVGTATATVNSLKLTVASDANFSNVLDEITATFATSSDITFEPTTGTEWATGAYYKFTFNVTASGSSNKYVQFSGVKFYAPEGSSSDPSISADNVEVAYNATGGQIAYTVNNPVTGGSVSASTTADWLTLGSATSSPVAFTCSANTAAAARTATVTLTYAYGSETVTKNVTVTQDGNPNVVNNISDITAAGTYTVKGTIVAKNTRGFIVGDGTGYVYYYNTSYDQSAYNIGDKVKLSGSVVVYGGVYEFNNSTTITAATESNYVEETPSLISGADMNSRVASTTPAQLSSYVQYEGKLSVSGTHYNIIDIDGATTAQGSISYPISTAFTSLDGQVVIVKGYYVGVSSSTYYNTMLGSIEAVAGFVAAPEFDVPEGEYDAAQEVTITCATTGASIYYTLDGTDPTTSSTVYDGTPITISTTTTLKAIASDGTNVSEITSATYTIDTRIETHIVLNNGTDYESGHTFTITVGDAFTSPEAWVTLPSGVYLNRANSHLTCTGDNDDLATVNSSTGAVTLVSGATGTINVTIEYPGSENYKPCTGSYTVVVNAAVTPGDALFNETFAGFTGSGGRDGSFSGSVGSSSTENTDESNWTFTSCGGADKCLKFGTSSANGTFITRTITLTGDGTLTFSAAGWGDTKTNTLTVTTNDGNITLSGDTEVTLTNGDWADYTVNIAGATGSFSLTFTGKRGFIDDIKVVTATPDERTATTVTLNPATETYNVTFGETFTAPTATLNPAAAGGTLTYESSDETVATVDASTGAVTIVAAGTTTITAKFEGSTDYKPSQASYTLTVTAPAAVITSLQALQEATTSTSQDVTLQLTDIYVTAVKGTNNAYISDGTYGALIYTNNHGLEAGKKFSGTLNAKSVLYKGATEITNFDATGLNFTDGTLAAQTKTIGEITVANQSLPVKFENVTYDATNTQFTDGTNTIKYYDNFSVSPTLVDGHQYNITGIIVMYNNLQIAPLAATDVEDITAPVAVEAPVFDPVGGPYTEDQTVTITCATAGATIYYTLDGSDPTTESSEYTGALTITETTTVKAIAVLGGEISSIATATYTINKPTPMTTEAFVLVEDGTITEGDYLIVYEGKAMNTTITSDRLQYAEVTPDYNNIISTNNANIVWHIAKSGSYYTLYNAAANAYAAGTEVKSKAQMLADGTDNKALWSVAAKESETFDFTNKANAAKNVNATLRFNEGYGFACYSTLTGNPLSLYKKVSTVTIDLIAAQNNYKTMVAPFDMVLPNISDGAEAYIVTLNNEQTDATFERVTNIPAGTPIVLHAESAGSYELGRADTEFIADDVSANQLKVSAGEIEGDGTTFVLNKVNDVIGFYRLNDGMPLAAGKCYLKIEKNSDVKFIGINFDGEATGIQTIDHGSLNIDHENIYDLSGRKVTTPAKGLYIVGGKKVFIK